MNDSQRTANFSRVKEKLEDEGYYAEKGTISILKANIMAFVTAGPVALLCAVLFFLINPEGEFTNSFLTLLLYIFAIIASCFVHEFLHGLLWLFGCKNRRRSIRFGIMWKSFTPYCYCLEPLDSGQYLLGTLMPFLILGIGIFIIAVITNSFFLLALSFFNIMAAGGDTTIALMLLKMLLAFKQKKDLQEDFLSAKDETENGLPSAGDEDAAERKTDCKDSVSSAEERYNHRKLLILDSPTECGYWVFYKKSIKA